MADWVNGIEKGCGKPGKVSAKEGERQGVNTKAQQPGAKERANPKGQFGLCCPGFLWLLTVASRYFGLANPH
jgi:hypothetical protein